MWSKEQIWAGGRSARNAEYGRDGGVSRAQGVTDSKNVLRPFLMVSMTAALALLRFSSMVVLPVTLSYVPILFASFYASYRDIFPDPESGAEAEAGAETVPSADAG